MKEVRLDRPDRVPENLGDLAVGEIVIDTEDQRGPLLVWHPRNGGSDQLRPLTTCHDLDRRLNTPVEQTLRFDRFGGWPLRPDMVQADIHGDAIQPS